MRYFLLLLILFCNLAKAEFVSHIQPLSQDFLDKIKQYSWRPGCPVDPKELVSAEVSYWGFDNQSHQGVLIVNHKVANNIVNIFHDIYNQKFPIEKIVPIEFYQGNDQKAMLDNDTSAFLCRKMTRKPHRFSSHSYGVAIDINPVQNPYVIRDYIEPPTAKNFVNRNKIQKGMITRDSIVYQAFHKYGWKWGGDWRIIKDYQHFEKK